MAHAILRGKTLIFADDDESSVIRCMVSVNASCLRVIENLAKFNKNSVEKTTVPEDLRDL